MDSGLLKVLIVDDEKDARHLIRHYLQNISQVRAIEESDNVEEALFKTISFAPDLIFLDIIMPGRSGIELMELIEKRQLPTHIVVVSGAEDYVIRAIKSSVYDFLLKPAKKEDIEKSIDKFLKKRNAAVNRNEMVDERLKIRLSSINNYVLIDPNEIVYCEAEGSYTCFHMEDGTKETANSYLGMIEQRFSALRFFRISRSYLINLNKLLKINRGDCTCILISNKKKIKIRGSKKQLKLLSELDFE